jgi:hypothetical protein
MKLLTPSVDSGFNLYMIDNAYTCIKIIESFKPICDGGVPRYWF